MNIAIVDCWSLITDPIFDTKLICIWLLQVKKTVTVPIQETTALQYSMFYI